MPERLQTALELQLEWCVVVRRVWSHHSLGRGKEKYPKQFSYYNTDASLMVKEIMWQLVEKYVPSFFFMWVASARRLRLDYRFFSKIMILNMHPDQHRNVYIIHKLCFAAALCSGFEPY